MTGHRLATALAPMLILCAVMALSVHLGPDGSWDLRNYHLYNPFAALHKSAGTDLVPAQLQTFLTPVSEFPAYWLRFRLNGHPDLLDAILGLPTAIAAIIVYCIGLLLMPSGRGWLASLLAVAYGVTGAAGLPTTGTASSEMTAGCFVLGGFYVLLRALERPGRWQATIGGAMLGVAVAIKLTAVPYTIGAACAYLICLRGTGRSRAVQTVVLGAGAAVAALALGGWWWLHEYRLYGNPIFPYYNNLFRSPLYDSVAMQDDRFLPRNLAQAFFYPYFWAFQKSRLVSEFPVRDPRLAFAGVALLAYAASAAWRRSIDRAGSCVALFMVIGYVAWLREFSIFRYIAPLELLSGLAVLLPLRALLLAKPRTMLEIAAALGVFLVVYTRYPDWGRANPRTRAVSVVVPALPPDSMVLLLTNDALGYVAAFADPAVRFIGVNNNIVHPGDTTLLAKQVEAAVRSHTGPLFGVEIPGDVSNAQSLDYYGLHRAGDCKQIESNLDNSLLRLCRLSR